MTAAEQPPTLAGESPEELAFYAALAAIGVGNVGQAQRTGRAWALAERDRAERAEAIAAAERALRLAVTAMVRARGGGDAVSFARATREAEQASAALRALGVEP